MDALRPYMEDALTSYLMDALRRHAAMCRHAAAVSLATALLCVVGGAEPLLVTPCQSAPRRVPVLSVPAAFVAGFTAAG